MLVAQTDSLIANDQATAIELYNCHVSGSGESSIEFTPTGVPVAPGIGAIPAQTGGVAANEGYTVSNVYGYHSEIAHVGFFDSIGADTGDASNTSPRGGYSRAAQSMLGTNFVPMMHVGRHGTSMGDVFNDSDLSIKSTGLLRMAYLAPGTFQQVSENFAANDLSQSPAAGAGASVYARKQKFWQLLRSRGADWITSVLPTPRTVSGTDNTPINAGWARGGEADILSQLVEGAFSARTINAVVRSLALRKSSDPASDDFFVYADIAYSLDGTHFNASGYEVVMPEHREKVLRGNVASDLPAFTAGQKFLETFTAGAGASIKARASDSGHAWTSTAATDVFASAAGRGYFNPASTGMMVSAVQLSRNAYAEVDIDVVTAVAAAMRVYFFAGVRPYGDTAVSGYHVEYAPSTTTLTLRTSAPSGSTVLASAVISDPGSSFTMRIEKNGATAKLRALIGPKGGPLAEVLTAVDGRWWIAAGVALYSPSNGTATTGRQIDAVRAGNIAA